MMRFLTRHLPGNPDFTAQLTWLKEQTNLLRLAAAVAFLVVAYLYAHTIIPMAVCAAILYGASAFCNESFVC